MTRRRRPTADAAQPDLFAPRAPGWVEQHWPDLVRGTQAQPVAQRGSWARTIEGLAPPLKVLLVELVRREAASNELRIVIPALARDLGWARNTLRRHLDASLGAGLVMLRPITRSAVPLGYEIRIIFDVDDRERAWACGFLDYRPTRWADLRTADA